MKKSFLFVGFAIIVISCTEKVDSERPSYDSTNIIFGHVCGWCAGADSLFITDVSMTHTAINYCDDITSKEQQTIHPDTWNNLIQLLDLEEFLNISINTCYVCVDGCDTWIRVTNDSITHMIRFGHRDSLIVKPVQPFIDALYTIRQEFLGE